ncbi:MBL fold metallo-hydrolase [Corallococcus sp. CA053C]|uniref:MBL fold metallo-hydrolase n=1 Tax=Corallococcus sp. CA053C TaxID=2316732 RepID=UPI0013150960|nr:MBL fold metallo-hydrolase [Corallococcus sp. CA053C]
MRRTLWRRLGLAVAALLLVLVVVVAVGLSAVSVPDTSRFDADLGAIRALAVSTGAPLPVELRSQRVGRASGVPHALVVAGDGFGSDTFEFYAYQLVYADGRTVLVDVGSDAQTQQAQFPGSEFDAAAYARIQEALRRADATVVTHEHFDHCAGIAHSAYLDEVAGKVHLTDEQLNGPDALDAGFTAELRARFTPLKYERMHLLRPGVVLIKAPGHTPGTQLVYVRLADGRELLLVGDVAWHQDNIRLPRMHPRLTNWLGGEDAQAMAHQLRWLHDLQRTAPELHQVVAHDGARMQDHQRRGLILDGLR